MKTSHKSDELKKGGGGVVHKSGAYDHYALTYTYTKNNIKTWALIKTTAGKYGNIEL
jgi:hypothetical protein